MIVALAHCPTELGGPVLVQPLGVAFNVAEAEELIPAWLQEQKANAVAVEIWNLGAGTPKLERTVTV